MNLRSLYAALAATALAGGLLPLSAGRAEMVSALGRVLPVSGVIDLYGASGQTFDSIAVQEGQTVQAGESLARLSSYGATQRRIERAEKDLAVYRRDKERDLAVAQQRVEAAVEEAKISESRYDRINASKSSEFVSPDTVEQRSMARNDAELKLADARATLEKTREADDRAISGGEAELSDARAALAQSEVRAPFKSRILKMLASPGASTDHGPLLKLGDTSVITVVAEVYESDILKIKSGMKATIGSTALPRRMSGIVQHVGTMVYRNSLQSLDPTALTTARVVEVSIRMDDVAPLDRLIFLQVDVSIEL